MKKKIATPDIINGTIQDDEINALDGDDIIKAIVLTLHCVSSLAHSYHYSREYPKNCVNARGTLKVSGYPLTKLDSKSV